MSQQPTWAAIEAGLLAAVANASGLSTIWSFQNSDSPALDFVRLSLGTLAVDGIDYIDERIAPAWSASTAYAVGDRVLNDTGPRTYACTAAGTSAGSGGPTGTAAAITDGGVTWAFVAAGSEIALTTAGVREVALEVEVFTASTVEAVGKAAALSVLDKILGKLRLPTARGAFAAVGVVPFDPGPAAWIPDLVSVGFRGRAVATVRCRMPARAFAEYTTWIAQTTVGATIKGSASGADITATIVA